MLISDVWCLLQAHTYIANDIRAWRTHFGERNGIWHSRDRARDHGTRTRASYEACARERTPVVVVPRGFDNKTKWVVPIGRVRGNKRDRCDGKMRSVWQRDTWMARGQTDSQTMWQDVMARVSGGDARRGGPPPQGGSRERSVKPEDEINENTSQIFRNHRFFVVQ